MSGGSFPLRYAYKIEGHDTDDDAEDHESQEYEMAMEMLQTFEGTLQEEDYEVYQEDLKNMDKLSRMEKPKNSEAIHQKDQKTLGVPIAGGKKTAIEKSCSSKRENQVSDIRSRNKNFPCELASLGQEIRRQLEYLVLPSTPKKNIEVIIRLRFCFYSLFLLTLWREGGEWKDHPVVASVYQLLLLTRQFVSSVPLQEREDMSRSVVRKKLKDFPAVHKEAKQDSPPLESNRIRNERNEENGALSPPQRFPATHEIIRNRGLTRYRPKDRKNPRLNQRRKYLRGLQKIRSMSRTLQPEITNRFDGIRNLRPDIIRSRRLS